jgi:hypothetical protein
MGEVSLSYFEILNGGFSVRLGKEGIPQGLKPDLWLFEIAKAEALAYLDAKATIPWPSRMQNA